MADGTGKFSDVIILKTKNDGAEVISDGSSFKLNEYFPVSDIRYLPTLSARHGAYSTIAMYIVYNKQRFNDNKM